MANLSDDQSMQLLRLYSSLWEANLEEFFLHISVSGTGFKAQHDLFEQFYTETREHIHVLGEWMQRLGQPPAYHVGNLEDLGQVRSDLPGQRESAMISEEEALSEALGVKQTVVEEGNRAINQFENDPTTEDVAIEVTRGQEDHLYQLQQANEQLVD